MLSVTVGSGSIGNLTKLMKRFENGFTALAKNAIDPAFECYRDAVEDIFEAEGPGWIPLKAGTNEIRAEQGFDPEHPILERTGQFRQALTVRGRGPEMYDPPTILVGPDLIVSDEPFTSGNDEDIIRHGADLEYEFYTYDHRVTFHMLGDAATHTPARPMLPQGEAQRKLAHSVAERLYVILWESLGR